MTQLIKLLSSKNKLYLKPKGENGLRLHELANIENCMKSYTKKIGIIIAEKQLIELTKEIDQRCIDFAKWLIKEETEELMFDRMQDDLENTYENMLKIFKKEKGL